MKTSPGAAEFQLEHARKHSVNDVLTAVSGLQGIGSLLASIPHEGGVGQLSEFELEGLGNAILSLSGSIGSDVETIEGALESAIGGLDS